MGLSLSQRPCRELDIVDWCAHAAHLLDQLSDRLFDLKVAQRHPSAPGARERHDKVRDYVARVLAAQALVPPPGDDTARAAWAERARAQLKWLPARLEDGRQLHPCTSPDCAFDWSFLTRWREPVAERSRVHVLRIQRLHAFQAESGLVVRDYVAAFPR